jgi:hypothetical protein
MMGGPLPLSNADLRDALDRLGWADRALAERLLIALDDEYLRECDREAAINQDG